MRRHVLLTLLLCLAPSVSWAIWSDSTRKAENTASGADTVQITTLGTTGAGNFIVCAVSAWESGAAPASATVSDNVNGSYTQSFWTTKNLQGVGVFYLPSGAGGALTITANPAGSTADMWMACHEFAGGHATPASGTPASSTGTSTTANTTAMTPADNDVLLIAAMGVDTASSTITENAGGQGFSLSDENEPGSPGQPGSMVFKILSGAPGTPSETWTNASADWVAGIAAYKPAAGGGGGAAPKHLLLMGVGQ